MRITGGILSGRRINVPGGSIRPAMDKMRESLFAILGDLSGKSFLDIFSGSGIIALEAASRGAVYVESVEFDRQKRKTLLENTKISPVPIHCKFISAELYIKRARRDFDYIFLDPPFPYKFKYELIDAVIASPLMNRETLLLMHFPREEKTEKPPIGVKIVDSREYGRSILNFYKLSF